jgi:hypothetical protein
MRKTHTNQRSTTDLVKGSQPAAKSLFHKILGPKSLRLKILAGRHLTSRPQVVRNDDFTKSDEKKIETQI